ncbi:uncharacterized protein LOC107361495 [Tetranychus urticae]|uniref:uncharacterized protein LOC107361495 n=1 Tax=Tetranychus urticae TaxID=32264 RepID=UPI000D645B68|nr:uncharacterized protein LOC107361495 [Tetranychus urticae]
MLINELADDCLLTIFEYVNDLDDLINCYKVCVGWSYLIAKRARKVKYLLEDPHQTADINRWPDHSADYSDIQYLFDCVYYQGKDKIDVVCLNKLFPNLKIFELTDRFQNKVSRMDIVSFVRNHASLKGIIDLDSKNPLEEYCDKLEMLSCWSFESSKIPNGSRIKQLFIESDDSLEDVKRYAHDFPNLEKLQTSVNKNGNYVIQYFFVKSAC